MPLVSVLMTAYNREAFIADAIASVLAQTFTDFELVIVDDGSKDRTLEIARKYAGRDSRIRVFVNEHNLGDYPNRNRAASLARGKLLKYHDSDDLLYPHCLEVMVPLLLAYPQASFALSAGGLEWRGGACPMLLTPRMAYQREFLGAGIFNLGPACALFRAEAFQRLGYFPLYGAASDNVLWLRACATENVLLVPGSLFWYRYHTGQELSSKKARQDYLRAMRCSWDAINSSECPLEADEAELAKRNWTWNHGMAILLAIRERRFRPAWERWRNSPLQMKDWIRYFRRQRRNIFAGSPIDEHGNFVTPDWRVYDLETTLQEQAERD
jgi:glycosyltransferase involved in cell wall biosynthesis